jgi:hypothetical protein
MDVMAAATWSHSAHGIRITNQEPWVSFKAPILTRRGKGGTFLENYWSVHTAKDLLIALGIARKIVELTPLE